MSETNERSGRLPSHILICSSWHHGNTRRVADVMAEELDGLVLTPEEAHEVPLEECRLLGFGSGIYFARHDRKLLELVENAKRLPVESFIFSTAGNTLLWHWYHQALKRRLLQRGCQIRGEFNCPGWDTVGPFVLFGGFYRGRPNATDLARAREFARGLLQPGSDSRSTQ